MPAPKPLALTPAQVRAVRILAQGLPPERKPPLLPTLERTGLVRTLGGADSYLGVRARVPGLHRADLDAVVTAGTAQVIPAARGCIYLVAKRDVPLCLRFADLMSRPRVEREYDKAGIKQGEVQEVADVAFTVLVTQGPLTTDSLRRAMPDGSVRSLGERGKKVGISSPLPGALRLLEFAGKVTRTPEGGRLDTERYLWRATGKDPFANAALPEAPGKLHARMLELFVRTAGIGTLKHFCDWSGLAQRDARAALAHVDLRPVTAEGIDGEAFAAPDVTALLRDADSAAAATALLPFEDNLMHLAGGPRHLVDAQHHGLMVPNWGGGGPTALADAAHMAFRGVIADGRLCGFWEYDPDRKGIVIRCFDTPSKASQQRLDDLAVSTAAFLRDELGHGHSFSLDTDAEMKTRIGLLDKIGRGAAAKVAVEPTPAASRPGKAKVVKLTTAKAKPRKAAQ
ncbi:MAG TPA: crosslink repair DNA glycosylase YcaQ family protein [Planctomycetota bacterium]|nr:crosslink repair DNA glycosylase YcaQ family protein [Planctomycetota bacterium]